MKSGLQAQSLHFSYRTQPVLSDVTFCASEGTMCALLGPNGSGKTTLLKCLNGILRPAKGSVIVHDKVVSGLTRKEVARLMAVVPQQTSTVFSFTSLQMVVMGRAAQLGSLGLPSRKDKADAEMALDGMGVLDLASRPYEPVEKPFPTDPTFLFLASFRSAPGRTSC
jgi:iron complex transport system ATP-binding protein